MPLKAPVFPQSSLQDFMLVSQIAEALQVDVKAVHAWLNRADVILPSRPLFSRELLPKSPRVVTKADFEQFKESHTDLIESAQKRR